MQTSLKIANPAEIETECLAVIALDNGEKDKNSARVATEEKAVADAVADLISSGEVTGKTLETVLLHAPRGLKAKRLLIIGGGKAKNFSAYELRKAAGTAVRFLKPRGLRKLAFLAPSGFDGANNAVRAIVEGALVGDFDPDTYKSDRKDQSVHEFTVVAPANGNQQQLDRALQEARVVGESQNFTRELVNEPSNRMTPTILATRARQMCEEIKSPHLKCEILDGDAIRQLKMKMKMNGFSLCLCVSVVKNMLVVKKCKRR